jgi:hypothetical protein
MESAVLITSPLFLNQLDFGRKAHPFFAKPKIQQGYSGVMARCYWLYKQ